MSSINVAVTSDPMQSSMMPAMLNSQMKIQNQIKRQRLPLAWPQERRIASTALQSSSATIGVTNMNPSIT